MADDVDVERLSNGFVFRGRTSDEWVWVDSDDVLEGGR